MHTPDIYKLLATGGLLTGAAVLATCYPVTVPLGAAIAAPTFFAVLRDALAALPGQMAPNVAADSLISQLQQLSRRPGLDPSLLSSHPIRRLIGEAISAQFLAVSQDASLDADDRDRLKVLAQRATPAWEDWASHGYVLDFDEDHVTRYFSMHSEQLEVATALSQEDWLKFISALELVTQDEHVWRRIKHALEEPRHSLTSSPLSAHARMALASALCGGVPKAIYAMALTKAKNNDPAFAAIQLRLMRNTLIALQQSMDVIATSTPSIAAAQTLLTDLATAIHSRTRLITHAIQENSHELQSLRVQIAAAYERLNGTVAAVERLAVEAITLLREATAAFPSFTMVIPSRSLSSIAADDFYNGSRPTWAELGAGLDIEREVYVRPHGIGDQLDQLVNHGKGLRFFCIIGLAGVGKTTILRRAAYDQAQKGTLVLSLSDPQWHSKTRDIVIQLRTVAGQSPVIVVIDDFYDLLAHGNTLSDVLRELERDNVVVLLAEHAAHWPLIQRRTRAIVPTNCVMVRVHQLTDAECDALVDRILLYEQNHTLTQVYCTLSRADRLALCRTSAERHLVVAMLQMRHGQRFVRIIENEYERLPSPGIQQVYALVCYHETLRMPMPRELVRRLVPAESEIRLGALEASRLLEAKGDALVSRNSHIARVVTQYVFHSPDVRCEALQKSLGHVDFDDTGEDTFFRHFFTRDNSHSLLVNQFEHDAGLTRVFFRSLLPRCPSAWLRAVVLTSYGMAERLIAGPTDWYERARPLLEQALKSDPEYAFAYRQLGWLEFAAGNWDAAAKCVKASASLEPNNRAALHAAARVLSLSKLRFFVEASDYWERLIALDSSDELAHKQWEEYKTCQSELHYLGDLKQDGMLPEFVWEKMRPGLRLYATRFGPDAKETRRKLKGVLAWHQQLTADVAGEMEVLLEVASGATDRELRGLYLTNAARWEFLAWRHGQPCVSVAQMEQMFQDAIKLAPKDPFAHCWYGTYLKDVKDESENAEKEYRLALELCERSGKEWLRQHPLVLNNLGLLIIDEVCRSRRHPNALIAARQLLATACERVPETTPDFFWPEHSLDWCKSLIAFHNVVG